MSRYRNRALKASAALWLLVLLADAGWVATSRAALTAAVVLGVCVLASAVLFGKFLANMPRPEPVPARLPNDQRR